MLQQHLAYILSVLQQTSEVVKKIYAEAEYAIIHKKDKSPLTQADIESNKIIIDALKQYSDYPILSEEDPDDLTRLNHEYVWLVDALDGTKEFIHRNGEFTVNIALIRAGRPIFGAISVPEQNLIFYGLEGKGAFVCDLELIKRKRIYCSKIRGLKTSSLAVSRSHLNPHLKALLESEGLTQFIPMGSAMKYCAIAQGKLEGSIRKTPLMEWDIAASDCILREAGGKITNFLGENLVYNKVYPEFAAGIIASNKFIHADLFNMVN
jgi:3'(2'), 5'-bisphosphate nucleotidase